MKALNQFKTIFEKYLEEQTFTYQPKSLYDPIQFCLKNGGKRIRPTSLLAINQLFAGKLENALPASYAIELFHNFTLIHDDIMDEADSRRGELPVYLKYNTNTAILSGDVMFTVAYEYLLKSNVGIEGVQLFTTTAREVCEGQQYDMDFENRDDVSIEEYIEMIRLKTAVLFAASLKIGAITANASKTEQEHIYQYGMQLGIAFQIMDDILDVFADKENFGKKVGGDIIQNKKTYLLIRALELCNADQKEELTRWLELNDFNEKDKVNSVKQIYIDCGVVEDANHKMNEYYQTAMNHLEAISVDTELLKEFSAQLMKRKK